MRFGIKLAAACAAISLAAPSQAASVFRFEISVTARGQQAVYDPSGPFCGTNPQGCIGTAPFQIFLQREVFVYSDTGAGNFAVGDPCANCEAFSGSIGGGFRNGFPEFFGQSFVYQNRTLDVLGGSFATASNYRVVLLSVNGVPPIPEPATWAMLVLGFGAAGAMIRRQRQQALVTYAA